MTFEELKTEADNMGYKLIKKPDWDCSCAMPYPNKYHERKTEIGNALNVLSL